MIEFTEIQPENFTGWCKITHHYRNEVCRFKDGMLHSENTPALFNIYSGGQHWFKNGRRHRLDGPAIEFPGSKIGPPTWWIDYILYSEEQFWRHPLVLEHKLNRIVEF